MKQHWIFLRGLLREQRHWEEFPKILEQEIGTKNNEFHFFDFDGIGTESDKSFPRTMRECVDSVRARAQEKNILRTRPIIVSVSLGSMCAMEWTHLYPNELKGVVLINSSASNLAGITQRLSLGALKTFAKIMFVSDKYKRESLILKMTSRQHDRNNTLARKWAAFAPHKSQLLRVGVPQLWVAARYKAPENMPVPCLVLSSARDALANPICSAYLAERFSVPNHIHLSAGHDLTLDDPSWVSRKLREWSQGLLGADL